MLQQKESPRRASIIRGPRTPGLLDWTFNDVLREQSKRRPRDTAILCPHQNRRVTYHELQQRSRTLAAVMLANGVVQGDRVAVFLGNRSEYIEVISWSLPYTLPR